MEQLDVIESAFDLSLVGRWGAWHQYRVTTGAVESFAHAIQADPERGVPLLFAAMPAYAALLQLLPGWLSPAAWQALRSMHGAYDVHLRGTVQLEQTLRSRARVLGVREKPALSVSFIELVTEDEDERELLIQYYSLVHPATTPGQDSGEEPPPTISEAPLDGSDVLSWRQQLQPDLASLYADATGDRTAIHTDHGAAERLGLPGTVLQGLCTLGVVSTALLERVSNGGSREVRRLAARFTDTVLPGDTLRTVAAQVGRSTDVWAFQTSRRDGPIVLGHAHLQFAPLVRGAR